MVLYYFLECEKFGVKEVSGSVNYFLLCFFLGLERLAIDGLSTVVPFTGFGRENLDGRVKKIKTLSFNRRGGFSPCSFESRDLIASHLFSITVRNPFYSEITQVARIGGNLDLETCKVTSTSNHRKTTFPSLAIWRIAAKFRHNSYDVVVTLADRSFQAIGSSGQTETLIRSTVISFSITLVDLFDGLPYVEGFLTVHLLQKWLQRAPPLPNFPFSFAISDSSCQTLKVDFGVLAYCRNRARGRLRLSLFIGLFLPISVFWERILVICGYVLRLSKWLFET